MDNPLNFILLMPNLIFMYLYVCTYVCMYVHKYMHLYILMYVPNTLTPQIKGPNCYITDVVVHNIHTIPIEIQHQHQ